MYVLSCGSSFLSRVGVIFECNNHPYGKRKCYFQNPQERLSLKTSDCRSQGGLGYFQSPMQTRFYLSVLHHLVAEVTLEVQHAQVWIAALSGCCTCRRFTGNPPRVLQPRGSVGLVHHPSLETHPAPSESRILHGGPFLPSDMRLMTSLLKVLVAGFCSDSWRWGRGGTTK